MARNKPTAPASSIPRNNPVLASGLLAPFVGSWPQVLKHSSTSLRSHAMQPPPPALRASARRPRLARSKTMEATMRVLSIKELMRLTRIELTDLYVRISNALPDMPEGSQNRQIALINLRNIRWVLARHDLTP